MTKWRILCVEDNEDTCFMLTTLFRTAGYEVISAKSVDEAQSLAGSGRFDLHILDYRYPDGTGDDLCRRIRTLNTQGRIIFYSGAAYESDRAAGLCAGAQKYVTKPDIDGLMAAVAELLAQEQCTGVGKVCVAPVGIK